MLKRIWQWIKGVFQHLFGGGTPPQSSSQRGGSQSPTSVSGGEAPKPLDDADYEFLFMQLLEGVSHGWQQDRILRWFEGLQGRITYAGWVAWLQRFGEKLLASPTSNTELAGRLVRLGEMLQMIPSLQEIGVTAYTVGMQRLDRNPGNPIWEYDGPDAEPMMPYSGGQQSTQEAQQGDVITLDELLLRLQQDETLRQDIAQQLGIETDDPQVIVQEIVNQFTAANQATTDETGV